MAKTKRSSHSKGHRSNVASKHKKHTKQKEETSVVLQPVSSSSSSSAATTTSQHARRHRAVPKRGRLTLSKGSIKRLCRRAGSHSETTKAIVQIGETVGVVVDGLVGKAVVFTEHCYRNTVNSNDVKEAATLLKVPVYGSGDVYKRKRKTLSIEVESLTPAKNDEQVEEEEEEEEKKADELITEQGGDEEEEEEEDE